MKKLLSTLLMLLALTPGKATIFPGDIVIAGIESSKNLGNAYEVLLVTLARIDAGEVVYVTDGSFGTTAPFSLSLSQKDSYFSFTVGVDGLPAGAAFVIGGLNTSSPFLVTARSTVGGTDITSISSNGSFTLDLGGDDFWIYQGPSATSATNFIYALGTTNNSSQLDVNNTNVLSDLTTWGLADGRSSNYVYPGSGKIGFLGVDPNQVNFSGDIDGLLLDLGNSSYYTTDYIEELNGAGGFVDMRIQNAVPQPSDRFYNSANGLWYFDSGFSNQSSIPHRTNKGVIASGTLTLGMGDTLDVGALRVGDGSNSATLKVDSAGALYVSQRVTIEASGVFEQDKGRVFLYSDFEVKSGGVADLFAGSHFDYSGDLTVNGIMTLHANATGFSTFGLNGQNLQRILGAGTINAQMYCNESGWHQMSAPGHIDFSQLTFSNGMSLSFSGATQNVYRWDPSQSGWYNTTVNSDMGDSAYTFYVSPTMIPFTMNLAYVADEMDGDFVNGEQSYMIRYNAPTGNPHNAANGWASGTAADNAGWNLIKNPFWGHLDWETALNNAPNGLNSAMYTWDPSTGTYQVWAPGVLNDNNLVKPLCAHFAQVTSVANGKAFKRG